MMRKLQLGLLLFFSIAGHSQSFFIKTGKNYTQLEYKNPETTPIGIQSDAGTSYEIGYDMPIIASGMFTYRVGLQLDEYNQYVEAPINAINYNTHYLGLNNSILFSVFNRDRNKGRLKIDVKGGINASKYISGKQTAQGATYDLNNYTEFKGFFIAAGAGLETKYIVSDFIHLSLGYDYTTSFLNSGNDGGRKLSFKSNQYKIGIHFLIN